MSNKDDLRRSYHPSELPDHLKEAIRDVRMGPEHDHLNALLDNELVGRETTE